MNNTDIKVSVIMPIYNAQDFLVPALDSIIDQTLKEIEIICIDDGSTDASLDIIKEYQRNDTRIRIVTQTNAGASIARNNGLRRARGEYVAFLDADDFCDITFLEELYSEAKKNALDMVISNYDIYNSKRAAFEKVAPAEHEDIYIPGGVTSKNDNPNYIFLSTNGAAWNKLFRTSFLIDMGLSFIPEAKIYEDVYFTINALSLAERVGKVHKTLIHHRVHSDQQRARVFRQHYAKVPKIYAEIKKFLMSKGMYAPLSQSFLNLTATKCFKLFNILGSDQKEQLWNLLHGEYSELLGWHERHADEFDTLDVCDFVANVVLYDFSQYQRRLKRGVGIREERLDRAMKNANQKKKFRSFFSRIFHKKKAAK